MKKIIQLVNSQMFKIHVNICLKCAFALTYLQIIEIIRNNKISNRCTYNDLIAAVITVPK